MGILRTIGHAQRIRRIAKLDALYVPNTAHHRGASGEERIPMRPIALAVSVMAFLTVAAATAQQPSGT